MAAHNELGKIGEQLAVSFLQKKCYAIICRNWRHAHFEIDIIATKGKKLHFIEVKTRSSTRFGHPEDSVTPKKFAFLKKAADQYLYLHPGHQWIQFDILSITIQKNENHHFYLIEDVYM